LDEPREPFLARRQRALGAALIDRVPHPIREDGVLVGSALLLNVVRGPRGDGVARDLLGPLSREQHERNVDTVGPYRIEQFEPRHSGHVVVADDAVERPRSQRLQRVSGRRLGPNRERVVETLQIRRDEVRERAVVVDVENPDPLGSVGTRLVDGIGHVPHVPGTRNIVSGRSRETRRRGR